MKKKYIKKITKLIDSIIINILLKLIYKIKYFFVWNFYNLMKKLNKLFSLFVKKPLLDFFLKIEDSINHFFKKKTKTQSKISNFNKYFIIIFSSFFLYLFYLLTPLLYDKNWIQATIEKKLINDFKIHLSSSADISYLILPAPHFLIKDSKILIENNKKLKSIAEIKNLKLFLSQKNFFNKEKINFKSILINKANFTLSRSDLKIFNDFSNGKFSDRKTKINNSKIFFKDNSNQIVAIAKLNKANLFYDSDKLLNDFNLKGEIFSVPFIFNFKSNNDQKKIKKSHLRAKMLKLNISNQSINENNKSIIGKNTISFLNSTIKTEYETKKEKIIFMSENSKTKNLDFEYNGKLSINPFDLNLKIDLENYEIFKLFNINTILTEFIKSGVLINENISVKVLINSKTSYRNKIYQNANLNFNIVNGKINLNNSKLVHNRIGDLKINNSNLFIKNNKLLLNANISIDIKDQDFLFSFLNTSKKSRKDIKNILVNLDYDFLSNQFKFNYVRIDDKEVGEEFLIIIDGFNDNNLNNLTKSRRLINQLLNAYDG